MFEREQISVLRCMQSALSHSGLADRTTDHFVMLHRDGDVVGFMYLQDNENNLDQTVCDTAFQHCDSVKWVIPDGQRFEKPSYFVVSRLASYMSESTDFLLSFLLIASQTLFLLTTALLIEPATQLPLALFLAVEFAVLSHARRAAGLLLLVFFASVSAEFRVYQTFAALVLAHLDIFNGMAARVVTSRLLLMCETISHLIVFVVALAATVISDYHRLASFEFTVNQILFSPALLASQLVMIGAYLLRKLNVQTLTPVRVRVILFSFGLSCVAARVCSFFLGG